MTYDEFACRYDPCTSENQSVWIKNKEGGGRTNQSSLLSWIEVIGLVADV